MNKQILLLAVIVAVVYSACRQGVAGCKTCDDDTCSVCDDAKNFELANSIMLDDGTCICKPGFYIATFIYDACSPCSAGCYDCALTYSLPDSLGPAVCITCNTTGNFVANGSSCRCADGFYLSGTNTCVACQFGAACTTCDSSTCLTCSGDNAIASGQTVCSKKCSIQRCLTCFNSTICSQCVPNATLALSQATCTCLTGFFSLSTACTACIDNCDVCTAATGCTTCKTGFFGEGNFCSACAAGCDACTTATDCTACKEGFVLDIDTKACFAFEFHLKLTLSLLVIAILAFFK